MHASVVFLFPEFLRDGRPAQPGALEVKLEPPQPLPVAPPEPNEEPRKAPPPRKMERAPQRTEPSRNDVLALPEAKAPAESTFSVPATKPAEPPAAPEPKGKVVSAPAPLTAATYLRTSEPPYPMAARRAGEQGTVVLRALVTTEGPPARVDLHKSSGSAHLDNAAIETVKGWRFRPARRGNEVVESWVEVPVRFNLKEAS